MEWKLWEIMVVFMNITAETAEAYSVTWEGKKKLLPGLNSNFQNRRVAIETILVFLQFSFISASSKIYQREKNTSPYFNN